MVNRGKYKVLKTTLTACDYGYLLLKIRQNVRQKIPFLISPATTYTLVRAYNKSRVQKALEGFNAVVPDSFWLAKSLSFLYGIRIKRVYGPRLMLRVLREANRYNFKIYLYGSQTQTLKGLTKKLKMRFKKLDIVGASSLKGDLIAALKANRIDILFVALGSPRQDVFSYELSKTIPKDSKIPVIIPVGAAFDFISGVKKTAPVFMQESGFEWLFRLLSEPARLWKRYLVSIPLYLVLIFVQKFKITLKSVRRFSESVIASIIFIGSFPLLLFIYLAVKLDSRGPFIFMQKRMGKDKKPFTIYKIRTMVVGAERLKNKYSHLNEADGPVFKIIDDPRLTRVGKVISRTGMDELPQLINVIKGQMAFVGPRPLPMEEAEKIPSEYWERFSVRPGITSSWVIKGSHNLSFKKWMELDMDYVGANNVLVDLKIAFLTLWLIIKSTSKVILKKA